MSFGNFKIVVLAILAMTGVGGGAALVLRPPAEPQTAVPPAVQQPAAPLMAFPMRFTVHVSGSLGVDNFRMGPDGGPLEIAGDRQFLCDLSRTQNMRCQSPSYNKQVLGSNIGIVRFAHDPSRVTLDVFGRQIEGVTWDELAKGFRARRTTITATPAE